MTTVADIRKQYPQYSDLPDETLVNGFHAKFYSDIPLEEFHQKVGYKKASEEVRPTSADIPDDNGNKVAPPKEYQEPSILEKVHAGIETAGNIASSVVWGAGALPYGLVKGAITDKTATQEAEAAMEANPFISKGDLTLEYTKKAGDFLARVLPPVLPEISMAGMGTRLSSLINKREAFKDLSEIEKASAIKEVQKESAVSGRTLSPEEIHKILDLPEASHIAAKKKVDKLIKEEASTKDVEAAIKDHPLVGHYLEDYRTRYEQLASTMEKPAGEVKPPAKQYPELLKEGETPLPTEELPTTNLTKRADLEVPTQEVKIGDFSPEANTTILSSLGKESAFTTYAKKIGDLADAGLGTIATRIHNVTPEVGLRAIETDMNIKVDTHKAISASDKALHILEEKTPLMGERLLSKIGLRDVTERTVVVSDLKNKFLNSKRTDLLDYAKTTHGVEGEKAMLAFFSEDNRVGKAMTDRGLIHPLENHLPRIVKDRKGLNESLGYEMKDVLTKALEKEAKRQHISVDLLDDLSYSQVVNKYIFGSVPSGQGGAGLTKGRVYKTVTPEMQKFYYDPAETTHTYFERAWTEVHKVDFFGKSTILKDGKVDVDSSIGGYLNKLVREGKLERGSPKWEELKKALEVRWKYGHLVPSAPIQDLRNVGTLALIANGVSAVKNMSDFLWAPVIYGLRPAVMSAIEGVSGKARMRAKDFGQANHISEEFVGTSATQAVTDVAMKRSFWSILDPLGKTFQLNTAYNRAKVWSSSPTGIKKMEYRYKDVFGSDYPQLLQDVQKGENTHLTRLMSFWEVSQHQPLTKLQKTEFQIKNPNSGALLYHLKGYMIMQGDYARRNAYNEIKKGNLSKGAEMLTRIGIAWVSVGVAQKEISNILLGKDDALEATDIVQGALGQVGVNLYALEEIKKGNVAKGVGMHVLPPVLSVADMLVKQPKRATPIVGPWLAEREKEQKKHQKQVEKGVK